MKRPSKKAPRPKRSAVAVPAAPASVRVVGIGASAGGLEALEQFLSHFPPGSGLALVIVTHLDPTRKGVMPELLQRVTAMEVRQVKDRTRVRAGCVYIIPPAKDISLLSGVLQLTTPVTTRGLRLPIDSFFRSLAQDQQGRSTGILLSGMGSDGTLGLRAIKEHAGVVLVQTPADAKYDSMPRSAIDAGLADIVAPADELPAKLFAYLAHLPARDAGASHTHDARSQSGLEKVVLLLRARTGHDFSLYKPNTLHRRIERRMGLHQITKIAGYVRYLQDNPQELDLLFKELLIGVTSFFRDPEAWEQLREQTLPELLAHRSPGHPLRAWVTGCSSGEEAYSLAMVFKEAVEAMKPRVNFALQIFATDLDRDAVEKARQGFFPANVVADMSAERLARFFTKEDHGYRVRREIREMVTFAPQDLIMDPPFTKLDILSCRNLLIYLGPELQKKLIPLFHHSLTPGGVLFLGSAETIDGFTQLFAPLSGKCRLFRRLEPTLRQQPVEFPSSFSAPLSGPTEPRPAAKPVASLQTLADQLVLQHYAPPAALVNDQGDICYISGRTGRYLEPAAGKANWNIFAMAREGLRHELYGVFPKVLRQKEGVTLRGLKVVASHGEQAVDVALQRLDEAGPLQGLVMIVFTDVIPPVAAPVAGKSAKAPAHAARVAELERELQLAREETRSTREEMQTSQEELKSTNEEMQSTNEEMQSTNEELMTSKEEMQSLNEELQTVNAELQAKLEDLSHASNDMKNLLDSTDIATLFLDKELNVRRFTPQATKIIKLIPGDVGRPITDIVSQLSYPELADDGRTVLETLVSAEKPIGCNDGRWFTVRIMPYRTLDDRIDGLVITFADITTARKLAAKLDGEHVILEKRFASQTSLMEQARKLSSPVESPRPPHKKRAGKPSGPGKT